MKYDIKIPPLGESISQVTIGTILKPTGSTVTRDDELIELETDKLNQVLYAQGSGLVTITVKTGDIAKVGDVIGYIDEQDVKQEVKQESKKEEPKTTPVSASKEAWIKELDANPEPIKSKRNEDVKKPLSSLKKSMAKRLLEATNTTAMLTTFNEVDMIEVIKLRELYKEAFIAKYKTKLGFMSFFVKASVSALQAFPEVNSYLDGDHQIFRGAIDIGVAVSSDRGLIVPVIKHADALSFAQIEQQIDDFASRAKSGTLTFDDLTGGGFTITNGGLFGSMLSTPILNPPQCAILGMHKITKRAVVVDDQIVIRPMMYLALSYDHRVLDGKQAVSFLVHIKNMIEDPHRLELGV
ncbi:MAG: dihydrolipoyllysine-residue succinyltransferase [Chlamydiales bacterium]|nr:dihydrolipoyllysine-residue succinyltransferase [Chlamydiales bacterium]